MGIMDVFSDPNNIQLLSAGILQGANEYAGGPGGQVQRAMAVSAARRKQQQEMLNRQRIEQSMMVPREDMGPYAGPPRAARPVENESEFFQRYMATAPMLGSKGLIDAAKTIQNRFDPKVMSPNAKMVGVTGEEIANNPQLSDQDKMVLLAKTNPEFFNKFNRMKNQGKGTSVSVKNIMSEDKDRRTGRQKRMDSRVDSYYEDNENLPDMLNTTRRLIQTNDELTAKGGPQGTGIFNVQSFAREYGLPLDLFGNMPEMASFNALTGKMTMEGMKDLGGNDSDNEYIRTLKLNPNMDNPTATTNNQLNHLESVQMKKLSTMDALDEADELGTDDARIAKNKILRMDRNIPGAFMLEDGTSMFYNDFANQQSAEGKSHLETMSTWSDLYQNSKRSHYKGTKAEAVDQREPITIERVKEFIDNPSPELREWMVGAFEATADEVNKVKQKLRSQGQTLPPNAKVIVKDGKAEVIY